MTHSVQLVIGRGEAVERLLRDWPGARAVDLQGGWLAVPIDDALYDAIQSKTPLARRSPELDASPGGLEAALAAATREDGGLAYVETDYWGGTGGQAAMAYVAGSTAVDPRRSGGIGGPINQALRAIGVKRRGEDDEFDTIGLGHRRTMDDYTPEGPRRLRGQAQAEPQPIAKTRTLPVWVVLVLIAAFIALGVGVSLLR